MATINEMRLQMLNNFTAMTEKMDNITNDVLRLHARIDELVNQPTPITDTQMTELLNLSTAAKDRLTDIDATTPEV